MGIFSKGRLNRSVQASYIPPKDVHPLCPHCEQTLGGIFTQEVRMSYGKSWLYFCTTCHKVLGVSQRKGFWMG